MDAALSNDAYPGVMPIFICASSLQNHVPSVCIEPAIKLLPAYSSMVLAAWSFPALVHISQDAVAGLLLSYIRYLSVGIIQSLICTGRVQTPRDRFTLKAFFCLRQVN